MITSVILNMLFRGKLLTVWDWSATHCAGFVQMRDESLMPLTHTQETCTSRLPQETCTSDMLCCATFCCTRFLLQTERSSIPCKHLASTCLKFDARNWRNLFKCLERVSEVLVSTWTSAECSARRRGRHSLSLTALSLVCLDRNDNRLTGAAPRGIEA